MSETFWEMLAPPERELLRREGNLRRLARGEVLCHRNDTSRQVFVLLSGRAEVVADRRDGYEAMLAMCGPGDLIGELAGIDGQPRSATVRITDQAEVLSLPEQRFRRLLQSHVALTWTVLRLLTGKVRKMSYQNVDHIAGSVSARVVTVLIDLAARRGVPTEAGLLITSVTQQTLAAMVAASRVAVARELRELREKGLITTGRQRVLIPSVALLHIELDRLTES